MSLLSAFYEVAMARPKQIALITEKSQMSFSDVIDLVQLMDMELAQRGVRPGQTLVFDGKRGEFVLAMALLLSLRGFSVAFSSLDLAVASGLEVDRLITFDKRDDIAPEKQIVIEAGWFAALGTLPPVNYSGAGGGGTFLMPTSGSTGRSKLVAGPEEGRVINSYAGSGFRDISFLGRRFASAMNPAVSWSLNGTLAALMQGGSAVLLTDDMEKLPAYIDLYRVDTLIATPAILAQLTDLPDIAQFLTSLRDVRVGGAQTAPGLVQRMGKVCTARMHLSYGAAEVGTILMSVQDPANPAPQGFLGQKARDELELRLFDPDGTMLPEDAEEGVLGVRMTDPAQKRRYLSDAHSSEGMHDDFFLTGDLMRKTPEGYYFVGRVKNIVNVSGNKYSLEAIETHLREAFDGGQFAAVVEPDEDGLERVAVFYSGMVGIDEVSMERALKARFVALRVSRTEHLADMPMTSTGKVDRAALKARVA